MSALDVVLETDRERRDLLRELQYIEDLFAEQEAKANAPKDAAVPSDAGAGAVSPGAQASTGTPQEPPPFTWKEGVTPEERMSRIYERLEDVSGLGCDAVRLCVRLACGASLASVLYRVCAA